MWCRKWELRIVGYSRWLGKFDKCEKINVD